MKTGKEKKKLVLNKISITQLDKFKIYEIESPLLLIKKGAEVSPPSIVYTCHPPQCPLVDTTVVS